MGERIRVRIDEQKLLLEPDREGLTGAESVPGAPDLGRRGVERVRGRVRWRAWSGQGSTPSAARAAIRPNTSAAAKPLA